MPIIMNLRTKLRVLFNDLIGTATATRNVAGVGYTNGDYMMDVDPYGSSLDSYSDTSGKSGIINSLDLPMREAEGLMSDSLLMSRRQRYTSYDSLEELVPEVDATLNVYADEASSCDAEYHTIKIKCSNQGVKDELEFLFYKILKIDDRAYRIARNLSKYGDWFGELVVDPEQPHLGVMNINELDPYTIWRIQSRRGKLLEFQQTRMAPDYDIVYQDLMSEWQHKNNPGKTDDMLVTWKRRTTESTRPGLIRFAPAQVVHMVLGGEKRGFAPYGNSILVSARKPAYNLRLLEDSMLLYRLIRSPERRVYYVDMANVPPHKTESFLNDFKSKVKRRKIYNDKTGQIDERYNPWPVRRTTPVPMLDGRTLTIEEVAREYEQGKENWVHSVIDGPGGKIVPGKVVWCGKNYRCESIVRVWVDDGGYVDVAPEHPFVLRDGSSKRADQIQPGDSLMPLYRKVSSKADHKFVVGYPMVLDNSDGSWKFLHRVVAEDALLVEKAQAEHDVDWSTNRYLTVHHDNFNRFDASPSNLKWMGDEDHRQLHLRILNERWNGSGSDEVRKQYRDMMKSKWLLPESNVLREKARLNLTKYNRSDVKRRKTVEDNKKYDKGRKLAAGYNGTELHREHDAVRRSAVLAHWSDPNKRSSHSEALRWIIPSNVLEFVFHCVRERPSITRDELTDNIRQNDEVMDVIRKCNKDSDRRPEQFHVSAVVSKLHRMGMIEEHSYSAMKSYALENSVPLNHQVMKVEVLKDESDDVYCMTVVGPNNEHDRHNFAVQEVGIDHVSCVFVKNSIDDDLFIPVRKDTNTRVETLPGAANLGEIDDAIYFRRKFYLAVGIPPGYLEQTIEAQTNRLTLSSQAMIFAKKVFRVQRVMRQGLLDIATRHLILQGVPETLYEDLDITITQPSEWRELAQSEVLNNRATLAQSVSALNVVSKDYVRMNIMKMSEEENETEKRRIAQETIEAAELEGQKSLIAARFQAEVDRGNKINEARTAAELAASASSLNPPPDQGSQGPTTPAPPEETPTVDQLVAAAPEPEEMAGVGVGSSPEKPKRSRLDPADAEVEREGY